MTKNGAQEHVHCDHIIVHSRHKLLSRCTQDIYMLWFDFIFGLIFFQTSTIFSNHFHFFKPAPFFLNQFNFLEQFSLSMLLSAITSTPVCLRLVSLQFACGYFHSSLLAVSCTSSLLAVSCTWVCYGYSFLARAGIFSHE